MGSTLQQDTNKQQASGSEPNVSADNNTQPTPAFGQSRREVLQKLAKGSLYIPPVMVTLLLTEKQAAASLGGPPPPP
ncbi:MAG: hypothetical protein KZQ58_04110 [gamma proteobacterium symbiont of Bathyaustriella thionipta]|nr:hypothetical protein [gamma proteobacterium symbiont of Bathyaustriella thionipta]